MASARRPNTSRNGTVTHIDRAAAPPHNLEAEKSILGAMLISKAAIDTAAELLDPGDFYNPANGNIWAAIIDIWAEGRDAEILIVADRLQKAGLLEVSGGAAYFTQLLDAAATTAYSGNIHGLCDLVTDTARRRRLIQAAYEAIQAAEAGGDPDTAITALVDSLTDAGDSTGGWDPIPPEQVDAYLDEPEDADAPTLMPVDNGPCLLYPGCVHSFAGESGSAKSWLLLYACARAVKEGHKVLIMDFEDTGKRVLKRLIALGLSRDEVRDQVLYIGPSEAINPARWRKVARLIEKHQPAIAVLDGVTEAMTMHGLDLLDNTDIATFLHLLPRKIARLGPAVALIDHVSKHAEGRKGALGGQHKKAGLDGAAYVVEPVEIFGRGKKGRSRIVVDGKDRSGYVNAAATAGGTVAYLELQSWPDGGVSAHLVAPEQADTFEPTHIMERVSRFLEEHPGLSKNAIETGVKGRAENVRLALELLVSKGLVSIERGRAGAMLHTVVTPYRDPTGTTDRPSSLVRPSSSRTQPSDLVPSSPPIGDEDEDDERADEPLFDEGRGRG